MNDSNNLDVERFTIDKIKISKVNLKTTINFFNEAIVNKKYGYVCVTNVRASYIANHDVDYCNIQNNSLLTVPDGAPLVWLANNRGFKEVGRVSGKDLMDAIFNISLEKGYSHYFYGCSQNTINLLKIKLKMQYPGLDIKGAKSPPFQPIENFNIGAIAREVNALMPTFFWCSLGAPKQERLVALLQPHLEQTISIGVGLAFEYIAGTVKRAPVWVQKNGLEWLYRLSSQPERISYKTLKTLLSIIIPLIKSFFKS